MTIYGELVADMDLLHNDKVFVSIGSIEFISSAAPVIEFSSFE